MRRLLLTSLAVTLAVTGVVQSSLGAFTSTSASSGSVTASADWTPPTVSLRQPAAILRGTVTLTADAADAETSVATVVLQHRPSGTTTWTDSCTAAAAGGGAWSCAFATAGVPDGRYDLRAVATDVEGNVGTSLGRVVTIDNVGPVVAIAELPDAIRATYEVTVAATDAGSGVASVRLQRSVADANTWTDVCTTSTAPYRCALSTTGLANDDLDLRAIATDHVGNTTVSTIETVLVDNAAPAVTVTAPSGTLSGTVTIGATASDAHSGVAEVTIQRRLVGAADWTTICVDASAPYSCRFDTTQVAAGTYDLRAIAVDVAGNSTTSSSVRRGVSNEAASVSVEDPGDRLSGTVEVVASANAPVGIRDVRLEYRAAGTSAWTTLCADATAPYTCNWDTTQVVDGLYELRAILTDAAGVTTTSAVVTGRQVDNSPLRGLDVQGANGGTLGRIDAGDTLELTYSDRIDLSTVVAGWNGSARSVLIRVRDGALVGGATRDDTVDVFIGNNINNAVQARVGAINLRGDYIKNGKQGTLDGTLSARTAEVDGAEVTVLTIRFDQTPHHNLARTFTGTATMVWTPSPGVRGIDGQTASTAQVLQTGGATRSL